MLRVYVLPQSADHTHQPNIDRKDQQGGCGDKDIGNKEHLKQASDVGDGRTFRSVNAFLCETQTKY